VYLNLRFIDRLSLSENPSQTVRETFRSVFSLLGEEQQIRED